MSKRIGIPVGRLHDKYPRGVHRVARAITEQLVASCPPDIELLALLRSVPNQHDATFEACDLRQWLAQYPLRAKIPGIKDLHFWVMFWKNLLPPFLYEGGRRNLKALITQPNHPAKRFARRIARLFRRIKHPFRNPAPAAPEVSQGIPARPEHSPKIVTARDLDLVMSFEAFEEIWEVPWEMYPCRTVGWFYDAIPLRIDEGLLWDPQRFTSVSGQMVLRANFVICDSRSAETDLHRFLPPSVGKTGVVHLGHDRERFSRRFNDEDIRRILRQFKIDPDIPYLVFVGTIEPRKNAAHLLEACLRLKRTAPDLDFQLVMVGALGGQPGWSDLLARTRRHLPVIVTRYADDATTAALMQGARAFLFPSLWEGFGIPPLEAMSAHTLVVTSDVSSLPEVCDEHAVYCDPYDPADIGQAIQRCLIMPEMERANRLRRAQGHAALYTWERAARNVWQILDDLLLTGPSANVSPESPMQSQIERENEQNLSAA